MRVALCSLQRAYEVRPGNYQEEPVHLVPMHNRLLKKGFEPRIFDFPLIHDVNQVKSFAPDVVGVTLPAREFNDYPLSFLQELKELKVPIILGGIQVTLDPEYFAGLFKPQALVLSQGEPVMDALADRSFKFSSMTAHPFHKGMIEGAHVFRSDKLMPLDRLDFTRPYDVLPYGVGWATPVFGCVHECIFCVPDKRRTFRSPQKFLEEMLYLAREHKIKDFANMGPDFGARPKHATEIVRNLLLHEELTGRLYEITMRIDSLAKCIKQDSKVWKEFFKKNIVSIRPGIESFLPQRLLRLGKYKTLELAKKQNQYLSEVLEFLKDTESFVQGTLIRVDPESTFEEVFEELDLFERFLRKYPRTLFIHEGDVFTYLRPAPGSRMDKMYKKINDELLMPINDSKFENGFFLLFNFVLSRVRVAAEAEHRRVLSEAKNSEEFKLLNHWITLRHIEIFQSCFVKTVEFLKHGKPSKASDMNRFIDCLVEVHFET